MRVSLQKAFSFFLTGSLPEKITTHSSSERYCPTDEELADMDMTRDSWDYIQGNSFKFNDPTLSLGVNWDTLTGYFRNSALSVFDSLFSGVGAGLSTKLNFLPGLFLAISSIATSCISSAKKGSFLSSNFAFDNYGGRLIRSSLHVFDSIFSRIGEKGANYQAPSILASLAGLFTLNRVLKDKSNENLKVSYGTIGGTLGRTAIHHGESMLATKANDLSSKNPNLGAFLATSSATLGLLLPEKIKNKNIPVETLEGLSSLVVPHFLDSLFSNIGNSFSSFINKPKNLFLSILGFSASLPILSSIKLWNKKAPMPKVGGKLIRAIFNAPDVIAFNAGNSVGNGKLGIPLSFAFAGLTYLTCVSKKSKAKFKNIKIPLDTVGSLFQRLPFGFLYSMTSASGTKLSKLIPAPLLTLIGPALSFKIGELFKGTDAKYSELKGLMIRNATHLWESTLASAGFKTGRMLTGIKEESDLSGSLFGERWITDDGQIVQNMAMGKQMNQTQEKNILHLLLSSLGGVGFAAIAFLIGKYFMKRKTEPLHKEVSEAMVSLPITKPVPKEGVELLTAA